MLNVVMLIVIILNDVAPFCSLVTGELMLGWSDKNTNFLQIEVTTAVKSFSVQGLDFKVTRKIFIVTASE